MYTVKRATSQIVNDDLNASFNSTCTDQSNDSDTELGVGYQTTPAVTIQSAQSANIITQATGILYGFRTRHLSCIEENDSDSLHSTSMPRTYELMKDADEAFKRLTTTTEGVSSQEMPSKDFDCFDFDEIAMIDETRICDLDYLDELSTSTRNDLSLTNNETDNVNYADQGDDFWQQQQHSMSASFNRNDIMMTSCYGTLNSSFGSEMSTAPPDYSESHVQTNVSTPIKQKPEPLYATPEKRREHNRSFDSTCPSQTSSIYGGSMTSSLDLKYMSGSLVGGIVGGGSSAPNRLRENSVPALDVSLMSSDGMKLDWSSVSANAMLDSGDGNPAEQLNEEMVANCLSAVENDLQSIRRLLEHDASGSVCPSCRISFDKGKRRKLIDTCGHERCYSCMFRNDQCPMCMNSSLKDVDCNNAQGYDTGIGGSTSTIVSPLGSPQPQLRSHAQRTAAAAAACAVGLPRYMQHNRQESISPEYHRYASIGKLPKPKLPMANGVSAAAATGHGHVGVNNNNNNNNNINNHTHTVTVDIHNNSNNNNNNINNNNYSEINASVASFATPPTRRRFFNHKNLRNALTGHRRTASNGGCPIDTTSILANGKETNALNTSTCSDSAVTRRRRKNVSSNNLKAAAENSTGSENRLNRLSLAGKSVYAGHLPSLFFGKIKSLWSVNSNSSDAGLNQLAGSEVLEHSSKDQLCARLGLLLNDSSEHSGNASNTTTTSSSSSQNISPEQTLAMNGCAGLTAIDSQFGSQLSVVTKDDTLSLSSKFKVSCSLTDSNGGGYEAFPVKTRKSVARRSARPNQLAAGGNKRAAIYKPAGCIGPQQSAQLTLKPLFFEVPLQEPDPPFIGRQWLVRELANILMGTETPGVLINGNPGTGKTAFILQLVEYSCFGRRKDTNGNTDPDGIYSQINVVNERMRALASHIVGYHFCQADANLTCLVPDFVHSLAAQLCQAPQLIAYREYLLNEPHLQNILSVKECIADAERVMRMAILEPLTILKRSGKIPAKTCVILVDALCEAEYHRPDHGHTIATFLAKMTQHFPSWLKVVATVRTQMLEFVKGLSYTKMTLDSWASNDLLQKDMLDYIAFRVNHSLEIQHNVGAVKDNSTGQLKFIGHLQALTKGSMLYAKLILDLIERGQLVVKSTSYKVLPVSLAQIFLLHFNLRFPTLCSFEKAADILNVCLAALYPLTLNEIYYTICAMKTDEVMSWDEFMQRFKLLDGFIIKRIDNTYMFFHSSFREWLIRRDEGESPKFLCDFRIGHAAIAFRLSRLQAPLDAEQTLELGHHMLKAHIYRNSQATQSPRDLQSFWLASVTDNISASLGSLRNVYSPNLKVSRLILLAGASPHHRTEFMGDATILCIAAHEGIVPMVSLLLEFGADVGLTNSQGCTPLILAAMRGHCDVVRLLVAAGSSLGQTDTTQRCALVHAARMGRLNVVKYLLACDWTPRPNSHDVSLNIALQQALLGAAAQDHVTILEDLLEMDDININRFEPTSGDLALTASARNGCVDTLAILIARGAKIDARNKQGYTALWLAVKEGHWSVVEKLLQNGADIDEPVANIRKTPLMIAAEEGHIDLLELLIERGANLEAQDHEGFTALSWACLRGRQAVAKCLIEKGCNKNHADNNGRTALDLAAYQGSANLVQYLLEQGANIEHIDVNGMRPLDRSIACRNIQVVQVFLRKGAKLGPTTWSMAMGKPEILVVLLNKLLEDGNVLYRKNRFHEAAHRYQYALRKISSLEQLLERNAVFAQLRTNLLLNLSRCKRKLNELDESIDLATQAIMQKPHSYEGYYARAKARMEQGELNEALVDANEAMQKAAQSGVLSEVVEVLKRIQAELLTRITNEGQQAPNGVSDCVDGIYTSCAGVVESHNEITDL